jgi:hypothetical protein
LLLHLLQGSLLLLGKKRAYFVERAGVDLPELGAFLLARE